MSHNPARDRIAHHRAPDHIGGEMLIIVGEARREIARADIGEDADWPSAIIFGGRDEHREGRSRMPRGRAAWKENARRPIDAALTIALIGPFTADEELQ